MNWLKKITIEPVMFLQLAGNTLTFVIFQNLFIDKICKVQLKYDDDICKLYATLDDERNSTEEFMIPIINQIEEKSSNFLLYNSLVENCLPVLLVLFLGVWSDKTRRRKPCLLLPLFGNLIRSIGLVLNAYFINWDPFVLLFTVALPQSMGGGSSVFHMAVFSYIADTTVPRSRTWRLGVVEACWALGSPVGIFLGAYLFEMGGYLCVFSASVCFHLIALLYTVFILREVPQPRVQQFVIGKHGSYGTLADAIPPSKTRSFSENAKSDFESEDTESLLNPSYYNNSNSRQDNLQLPPPPPHLPPQQQHQQQPSPSGVKEFLVGSLKAITKKRPHHTRTCLLSLGLISMLYGIMVHGEMNMMYLFTRNKFQWREQEFSSYIIYASAMMVIGLTIVLPVFSKLLKFSDTFSGALAAFCRCISRLCIALAPSSVYMYIGATLDIISGLGPLSCKSLASKCVLRDERGKVFAFLGCIEALVPLFAVPLFSTIYSNTLTTAPSTIFFVTSAISLVVFLIFSVLFICTKLKIVELSGTDTTSLTNPNPNTQSKSPQEDGGLEGENFYNTFRRFSLS